MKVLTVVGVFALAAHTALAQAPQKARTAPRDLKTILFDVGNSMGMFRGLKYQDSIVTMEVWGAGTVTVAGQVSQVANYRASINYVYPGLREDFTLAAPGAPAQREIRVVNQTFAWDETDRGMNGTPVPGAVRQRLVQLWSTPIGVVKAAAVAGDKVKVSNEGVVTVLSFPLPAPVGDVTMRATVRTSRDLLVLRHDLALPGLVGTYIERVETLGGVVSDTTYSEYGDWNWDDYKADVFVPRHIVQRRTDGVVWDLRVTNTNTYNPYVIMPVPENVRKAGASR